MIQTFVDRFMAGSDALRAKFRESPPSGYQDLDGYEFNPDPERIHEINDGDYQGTLVFVIGATGYQPNEYWYVKVSYGSCSGCDTLEHILMYDEDKEQQVNDLWTLALHVVQSLKEMDDEVVS